MRSLTRTVGLLALAAILLAPWPGRARSTGTTLLALPPGKYPVGFRVLRERDKSRNDRPIQISLWYPAANAASGSPQTFRDDFALTLSEKDFQPRSSEEIDAAVGDWAEFLARRHVSAETAKAWMSSPMRARLGAEPAKGKFPLVLVAQGNGESAPDQVVLCEYLAGHGFAVATSPSPTSLDGPPRSADERLPRSEEQAADLAFVAAQLANEDHIDTSRIGVVAYSFGANGALFYAMEEPRVVLLVSLDGSVGVAADANLVRSSPLYDPAHLHAFVLHIYEEMDASMKPDFALLREAAGTNLSFTPTLGLHHLHFTTLGFAAASYPDLAQATQGGPDLAQSLLELSQAILHVLEKRLQ